MISFTTVLKNQNLDNLTAQYNEKINTKKG
jgi:hypothetical protein